MDYWRSALASGEPGEIEGRLRRFDGVYRWFLFRATPSFDNDGRGVKWFGTNTDIEDRKRAESLLAGENLVLEMTAKGDSLESHSRSGFLGRIAAGGLFIIFTGALIVHLPDGWTLNWFGSKKGEGIEYFLLLLSLLLVIVLKGSGALSIDYWLTR